jgi:hypothetical protein
MMPLTLGLLVLRIPNTNLKNEWQSHLSLTLTR